MALSATTFNIVAFAPVKTLQPIHHSRAFAPGQTLNRKTLVAASESRTDVSAPAPVLDGKKVLPMKIMRGGLKGHKISAVYALLNSDYKRGYVLFNR